MASAAAQLKDVDALKEARLDALQYRFQLEQMQRDLGELNQGVAAHTQQQQQQLQAVHPRLPAHHCCMAAAELQEARLQAADNKYKLQLTELELLKHVDALQELQWQLDCVVAQLGLQQPDSNASDGATAAAAAADASAKSQPVDHMLLLSKVEDLRLTQMQLEEYKRRLAFAEGELTASQAHCAAFTARQPPAPHAAADGTAPVRQQPISGSSSELGAGGRELVGELLAENQDLRQQLAEADERFRGLERDYEVELLLKAEAEEKADSHSQGEQMLRPAADASPRQASQARQVHHASFASMLDLQGQAVAGISSQKGSPLRRRERLQLNPPASPSMEHIARRRLEVRMQEKDVQLGKLRGVVQQLEGKLIDAYKRQADLVMRESSWQEQEAQDRRIAQMDEDKARLAFAANAAQAEAEAARKEAAAQRRLVKRLQQQVAAAEQECAGAGGSAQMTDLLQKRVKVLEAQCMRLRLHAKNRKEEEEEEAAAAAAVARRQPGSGGGSGAAVVAAIGDGSEEGAAAENNSPNRVAGGLLEGNPVLEQWQAGKRLQKKVEGLQTKLREKTTALVSAQAGRSRAEEQVAQLEGQGQELQAALKQVQDQLRAAEQRSLPGAMVPVGQWHALLVQLEQVQQQHDALERQHAALQHRLPVRSGSSGSGSGVGGGEEQARQQTPEDLAARLLEKDLQLLDAHMQRDQAATEAERHRRRLHTLLDSLSPHPHDEAKAAVLAEARQVAGLPELHWSAATGPVAGGSAKPPGKAAGGRPGIGGGKGGMGGRRQQPGAREHELLDTIKLLKSALERTKRGLESGVSSSKYMQAVERAKQLRAQCQSLKERLAGASRVREELTRVQAQLGVLHGTNSALRSQLKTAKEQREEAASAREHMLSAQVSELERTLRERDAQMESLAASMAQVDEEVRVLVAEGLRPADIIQELLVLRPRLRELEQQNRELSAELAAHNSQFAEQLEALKADHELLRQRCERWEAELQVLCERHGEPLPAGLG